jgi:DNA-binding transcriptional LysR family regulator
MDLNEIAVFTRVVQAGSFTAAARVLAMPKSTVSRKVADLEQRLDARLLQRTTRKLSLTDAGRAYYEHGLRIVAELEAAERAVTSLQDRPRGLLRITAPLNAAWLGEIVAHYMKRNPEVQIELLCTARTVDLVEERFDLGIRAGALPDSSLVARSLGSAAWILAATPAYLRKKRRPRTPEDLEGHDFLAFGAGSMSITVRLAKDGRSTELALPARLVASDFDVLLAAARAGLGVALVPASQVTDDLRAGRLERVLREWNAPATPVHIVYPTARHLSAKVKSFVEHLQQRMTPSPWSIEEL